MELSFQYIKELLNKGRTNDKYHMEFVQDNEMEYCLHGRRVMTFITIIKKPNGDYFLYDSGLSVNSCIRRESDVPNFNELLKELDLDIQLLIQSGLKLWLLNARKVISKL